MDQYQAVQGYGSVVLVVVALVLCMCTFALVYYIG
jgi:hypothetical protein